MPEGPGTRAFTNQGLHGRRVRRRIGKTGKARLLMNQRCGDQGPGWRWPGVHTARLTSICPLRISTLVPFHTTTQRLAPAQAPPLWAPSPHHTHHQLALDLPARLLCRAH